MSALMFNHIEKALWNGGLKNTLKQAVSVALLPKTLGAAHLLNILLGSGLHSKPCLYKKGAKQLGNSGV